MVDSVAKRSLCRSTPIPNNNLMHPSMPSSSYRFLAGCSQKESSGWTDLLGGPASRKSALTGVSPASKIASRRATRLNLPKPGSVSDGLLRAQAPPLDRIGTVTGGKQADLIVIGRQPRRPHRGHPQRETGLQGRRRLRPRQAPRFRPRPGRPKVRQASWPVGMGVRPRTFMKN
jgi:hypothetical protein